MEHTGPICSLAPGSASGVQTSERGSSGDHARSSRGGSGNPRGVPAEAGVLWGLGLSSQQAQTAQGFMSLDLPPRLMGASL